MKIGSSIKLHRKNANITQKQFAVLCGISGNAMNQIECNVSFPSKQTLDKICEVLQIPLSLVLFSCIEDVEYQKKRNLCSMY